MLPGSIAGKYRIPYSALPIEYQGHSHLVGISTHDLPGIAWQRQEPWWRNPR
jgi:hypothetical protein